MSTSRAPLNGNASIAQRVQRYLLVDLEKNLRDNLLNIM